MNRFNKYMNGFSLVELIFVWIIVTVVILIAFTIAAIFAREYVRKNTSRNLKKDIANKKLSFLNHCEVKQVWSWRDIFILCNVFEDGFKKIALKKFPQITQSGIYAVYINNPSEKNFLPCFIGKAYVIFNVWRIINKFVIKNEKTKILHLPPNNFGTKIITYLQDKNLKFTKLRFAVLKNIPYDENIDKETEKLIKEFGSDTNGWN